jgi:exodeoxyribonuclease-3
MKVVSLNLQHGGGKRAPKILEWLRVCEADFIVLTEWRDGSTGQAIRDELQERGYHTYSAVRSAPHANGLLVAARGTGTADRITPNSASCGELLRIRTGEVVFVAAYFPQGEAKAAFFTSCKRVALSHRTEPVLLIGDLNTGRNDVDRQSGSVAFDCESEFCGLEADAELLDLWRSQHGSDMQEWSWWSSKYGFRLDHVFGNSALLRRYGAFDCRYDHGPRERGMSDHSAIMVTFGCLASASAIRILPRPLS